jgi:hypothetical protein
MGIDSAIQELVKFESAKLVGAGRMFYAIQPTEAFYDDFVGMMGYYPDGTPKFYTTLQAAIDACVNNRGDVVQFIGEWTSALNLVNLNKWGITFKGATDWNNITGGGNSNITCTGEALSTIIISHAKVHLENLVVYANGVGETCGIEFKTSAPSQTLIQDVEIVKNGGDAAAGRAIKGTTVPTRSLFQRIKITGNSTHAIKWIVGIQSASYGCVWKDIIISDTTAQAIYNVGSSGDLFDNITAMPSCVTGFEIGGVDAANSVMQRCHNLAAAPGTSTAIKSECYIAGLSAYT